MTTPYAFELFCPNHMTSLSLDNAEASYKCEHGCRFEIIGQIPRFVSIDNYASSFGLQWNSFRQTQLDSYTGLTISKDRLTRMVGGSLDVFRDQKVLEAGCGAGRFTEIMLAAQAIVFAVDISTAVEANFQNCKTKKDYFVVQADILKIPVLPGQFDIVVCIGVIQHTPDPEATIQKLCSYLKPGGLLVIDHYTYGYPEIFFQKRLRRFLLKKPKEYTLRFVLRLVKLFWPFHKVTYRLRNIMILRKLRSLILMLSPIVDYQDAYPELGDKLLYEWALLDTHDTLSDFYKHLRSADEIRKQLQLCGMSEIHTEYAGNGVEARARKPLQTNVGSLQERI